MRKIKFRGKATMPIKELNKIDIPHENGWVYGSLVFYGKTPYIVGDAVEMDSDYTAFEWWVSVEPESVGQFTGRYDRRNNKEIYEGDICDTHTHWGKGVVVFELGMFKINGISLMSFHDIEVIDEHDHLLEGATNG